MLVMIVQEQCKEWLPGWITNAWNPTRYLEVTAAEVLKPGEQL